MELSLEAPDLEDKYSDDDKLDNLETCTFTVDAPSPVVNIVTLIAEDAGAVFPVVNRKRRMYPYRFE